MSAIMDEPVFHVQVWINDWIYIVVVRSYSQMICKTQLPSILWDWEADWYPALDLRLAQ